MKVNRKQQNVFPQKKSIASLAWRQSLGKIGEQYVVNFLHRQGWQIIERNWHAGRYAEIDIIAHDPDQILVFIEVKTRMRVARQAGFDNSGYDKLDKSKIQKLLGCAHLYMAKHLSYRKQFNQGCRFDAFVLYYPNIRQENLIDTLGKIKDTEPEVNHIKGFLP